MCVGSGEVSHLEEAALLLSALIYFNIAARMLLLMCEKWRSVNGECELNGIEAIEDAS